MDQKDQIIESWSHWDWQASVNESFKVALSSHDFYAMYEYYLLVGLVSMIRESKLPAMSICIHFLLWQICSWQEFLKDKPGQCCPRSKSKSRLEEAVLDEIVFGDWLPACSESTLLSGLLALCSYCKYLLAVEKKCNCLLLSTVLTS